jgi:hypothetical protein
MISRSCFVSGHDFRHSVKGAAGPISVPATNQGVPHISLVFREMWDTTAADLHSSVPWELPIEIRGIPHLAKNERDMGHPLIRGTTRFFDRRVLTQTLKPRSR